MLYVDFMMFILRSVTLIMELYMYFQSCRRDVYHHFYHSGGDARETNTRCTYEEYKK